MIHYLLARGTVDDIIWPMVERKLSVIGQAVRGDAIRMQIDESKQFEHREGDQRDIGEFVKDEAVDVDMTLDSAAAAASTDLDPDDPDYLFLADAPSSAASSAHSTPSRPSAAKKRSPPSEPSAPKPQPQELGSPFPELEDPPFDLTPITSRSNTTSSSTPTSATTVSTKHSPVAEAAKPLPAGSPSLPRSMFRQRGLVSASSPLLRMGDSPLVAQSSPGDVIAKCSPVPSAQQEAAIQPMTAADEDDGFQEDLSPVQKVRHKLNEHLVARSLDRISCSPLSLCFRCFLLSLEASSSQAHPGC